jgi:hypothetical protein
MFDFLSAGVSTHIITLWLKHLVAIVAVLGEDLEGVAVVAVVAVDAAMTARKSGYPQPSLGVLFNKER